MASGINPEPLRPYNQGNEQLPPKKESKVGKAAKGALKGVAGAIKGVGRSLGMTPNFLGPLKENLPKEYQKELAAYFSEFKDAYSEKKLTQLIHFAFSPPPKDLDLKDKEALGSYFDHIVTNLNKSGLSVEDFTFSFQGPFMEQSTTRDRLGFMERVLNNERVRESDLPRSHEINFFDDTLNELPPYDRHALVEILHSAIYTDKEGEPVADNIKISLDGLIIGTYVEKGVEGLIELTQRDIRSRDLQEREPLIPDPTTFHEFSNPETVRISLPNLQAYFG
jgi:hypothetical protein